MDNENSLFWWSYIFLIYVGMCEDIPKSRIDKKLSIESISKKLKEAEDRIKTLEERQKVHRIIISQIKDFVGITKK